MVCTAIYVGHSRQLETNKPTALNATASKQKAYLLSLRYETIVTSFVQKCCVTRQQ